MKSDILLALVAFGLFGIAVAAFILYTADSCIVHGGDVASFGQYHLCQGLSSTWRAVL
jgi:hypothetical protein